MNGLVGGTHNAIPWRCFVFRALLFTVLSTFSGTIHAQTSATVNGTISDTTDAVIPGATIILSNASTGARFEVKSDSVGFYRFASVPPGPG
jgi:hypothetical protein